MTKELSTGTSQLDQRDHLRPIKSAKSLIDGVLYKGKTDKTKIWFFANIS
jgi:hypothetical protein